MHSSFEKIKITKLNTCRFIYEICRFNKNILFLIYNSFKLSLLLNLFSLRRKYCTFYFKTINVLSQCLIITLCSNKSINILYVIYILINQLSHNQHFTSISSFFYHIFSYNRCNKMNLMMSFKYSSK